MNVSRTILGTLSTLLYAGILMTALTRFAHAQSAPPPQVIFITIDGVQQSRLSTLHFLNQQTEQSSAVFLGPPESTLHVSNHSSKSLPGYRALFTGSFEKLCTTNQCNPLERPTLLDELETRLQIQKTETAVFASWNQIANAVAQNLTHVCGSIGFIFSDFCNLNSELSSKLAAIEEKAQLDRPKWKDSRYDEYTWAMAHTYMQAQNPRLAYFSFVDADEWAHHHNFKKVQQSLDAFEKNYQTLLEILKQTPGRLENTSIVVTTDHGRGRGIFRSTHGKTFPNSKKVFMYLFPSQKLLEEYSVAINEPKDGVYQQEQIRWTLETLLRPDLNANAQSIIKLERKTSLTTPDHTR